MCWRIVDCSLNHGRNERIHPSSRVDCHDPASLSASTVPSASRERERTHPLNFLTWFRGSQVPLSRHGYGRGQKLNLSQGKGERREWENLGKTRGSDRCSPRFLIEILEGFEKGARV